MIFLSRKIKNKFFSQNVKKILTQENKQGNSFYTEVVRIDGKTESPVCRAKVLVKHCQERGLKDKKMQREASSPLIF
jgi:hypothetical protein